MAIWPLGSAASQGQQLHVHLLQCRVVRRCWPVAGHWSRNHRGGTGSDHRGHSGRAGQLEDDPGDLLPIWPPNCELGRDSLRLGADGQALAPARGTLLGRRQ